MRWIVVDLHSFALACGPGGGASTGTTGGTGGSTTSSPGASSTSSDPTEPGTPGATTAQGTTGTANDTTGDGPGSTGDTGGSPACAIVDDGDYGECDSHLGWAFDGLECRPVNGCECAPDCDKFFPDAASCALACAAEGKCNEERITGKYLGKNPVEVGDPCDEVHACLAGPNVWPAALEAIWGAQTCQGEPKVCETDAWCRGPLGGELEADMVAKMCAVSLLDSVDAVHCVVWGP